MKKHRPTKPNNPHSQPRPGIHHRNGESRQVYGARGGCFFLTFNTHKMIIIISGNQGSANTTYAKKLANSLFPQTIPDVVEGIPAQEPSYLGAMTIFTRQSEEELPNWICLRTDYTMIYVDKLKTDTLYDLFQSAKEEIQGHIQDDPYAQSVSMSIGNVLINGKEVQMQLTFQREEDEFIDGFTAVMVRGCRKY
jgi:hypothetical protein